MRNRPLEPTEQRDWNDSVLEALKEQTKEQRKTNRLLEQVLGRGQISGEEIDRAIEHARENALLLQGKLPGQPEATPKLPSDAVGSVTTETVTTSPAANQTGGEAKADQTGGLASKTEQPSGNPKAEQTGGQPAPATPPDPGLPWDGYDDMNIEEVLAKARTVDDATRQRALAYEQKRGKRAGVIRPLVGWNS